MSRKDNCLDNAIIEIFFKDQKSKKVIKESIKSYNNDRIKLNKRMSPIKYRAHHIIN